jgi:hypothetical protein
MWTVIDEIYLYNDALNFLLLLLLLDEGKLYVTLEVISTNLLSFC